MSKDEIELLKYDLYKLSNDISSIVHQLKDHSLVRNKLVDTNHSIASLIPCLEQINIL